MIGLSTSARIHRLLKRVGELCEECRALRRTNTHLARLVVILEAKIARQAMSLSLAQERNATYKAAQGVTAAELAGLREFRQLMLTDEKIRDLVCERAKEGLARALVTEEDHMRSRSDTTHGHDPNCGHCSCSDCVNSRNYTDPKLP